MGIPKIGKIFNAKLNSMSSSQRASLKKRSPGEFKTLTQFASLDKSKIAAPRPTARPSGTTSKPTLGTTTSRRRTGGSGGTSQLLGRSS